MKFLHVLLVLIVFSLVSVAVAHLYVKEQRQTHVHAIEEQVAGTRAALTVLAELTDRNAPDEVVEEVVRDCTARTEFESLLVRLHELDAAELSRVDQLFAACGDHFALIKTYMSARLSEKLSMLHTLIELHGEATGNEDTYARLMEVWQEIVDLETERGELLVQQVRLQGEVITALRNGAMVDSKEIADKLVRAQEIAELLSVANTRVDAAREREKTVILGEGT